MFRHRLRHCSFVLALTCLAAGSARANGRFPKTVNVRVQPGNDQVILLAATFGLLLSRDGGSSFHWVCEEAIGYGGTFDPDYAIAQNGSIFATTFDGLRVSRDHGCTWVEVAGIEAGHWVGEVEIGPQGEIWAATSSGGMPNNVYLSTDNGQTFQPKNMLHETAWWKSLRVAPSDSRRVYLTGYQVAQTTPDGGMSDPQALMYRSDDGGDTWMALDLATVAFGSQPLFMLEQVAPDNANVVFARAVTANEPLGDALYRSTDAGQTWQKVLDSDARMETVLLRQNGDLMVGTLTAGVYRSSDGGDTWTSTSLPQMCCAAEDSRGVVYACGANWEPDQFALGRSTDTLAWEKVFRFNEVASALSCPPETVQYQTCEAKRWPSLCEQFGCNRADAGPQPRADAGPPPPHQGNGCCDAAASPHSLFSGLAVYLLVIALLRRRQQPGRQRTGTIANDGMDT